MNAELFKKQESVDTEYLRIVLQEELVNRIAKNPRYSLRAFAKMLKIQPPTLSHILKGKRKLPKSECDKIIGALGLNPSDVISHTNDDVSVNAKYRQFSEDTFNVMSQWYHFAILELVRLPTFKPETKWIASALGIATAEVSAAVERLIRLEMLEVVKDKWAVLSPDNSTVDGTYTRAALKKLQKQFLAKAIEALDETSLDFRDQSGMTVAVNTKDIPMIKHKIKNFRRSLTKCIETNKKPDEVYQLSISFFPLTKNKEL